MKFRVTRELEISVAILLACARNPGEYVSRQEIARCSRSTEAFATNTIANLARGGWVRTRRGRRGGVTLAKDPGQITIWDLICHLHPELMPGHGARPSPDLGDSVFSAFGKAERAFTSVLSNHSIKDLCERSRTNH